MERVLSHLTPLTDPKVIDYVIITSMLSILLKLARYLCVGYSFCNN